MLLPHLAAAHVDAQIVDWHSAGFKPSQFDLLVLRSCWDYHLCHAEFTDWLRRAAGEVHVLNSLETVLWNHSKVYLREVAAQGIEIAPTIFVTGNAMIGPQDRSQIESWPKIVVKPAVSASAHKTWLIDGAVLPTDADLARQMGREPFLVQQFIPEIQTEGEISFIYFDGRFSHAALKRPASGDFRVQQEHGGSAELIHPDSGILEQANEIAATVTHVRESLYCRIDAVARDGRLLLMELELIEPELFLGLAEHAAKNFAGSIVRRLG
jgi:glutathione synthase/RimK-type ligase-like ATP-grasp enzyme